MILVDAVTSLGGAELRFDDWGIDLAFAGTQKCLALPPGLCVFALSQRAIDKAATVEGRGFLFDFAATPERFEKGAPPATPCIPLAFALDRQLDRIAAEGIENRWKRHLEMQSMTLAWAEQHGFTPFVADPAHRSHVVATIDLDDAVEADTVNAVLRANGIVDTDSYRKLGRNQLRIALFPATDPADVAALTACIDHVVASLG